MYFMNPVLKNILRKEHKMMIGNLARMIFLKIPLGTEKIVITTCHHLQHHLYGCEENIFGAE